MAYKNKGQQQQQDEKKAPVFSLRSGVLSVSIWEQTGGNGTFYRVTCQRSYTEGEGDNLIWKHTDSFGRDDILIVSELLRQSWNWIGRKEAELKKAAAK